MAARVKTTCLLGCCGT